jgi:hypothetical protein
LLLQALGLAAVGIEADVQADVAHHELPGQVVSYPTTGLPGTLSVNANHGDLLDLNVLRIQILAQGVLGILTNVINLVTQTLISGLIQPLVKKDIDPPLSALLNPVFDLLGIQLGITDLNVMSRPSCSTVSLID